MPNPISSSGLGYVSVTLVPESTKDFWGRNRIEGVVPLRASLGVWENDSFSCRLIPSPSQFQQLEIPQLSGAIGCYIGPLKESPGNETDYPSISLPVPPETIPREYESPEKIRELFMQEKRKVEVSNYSICLDYDDLIPLHMTFSDVPLGFLVFALLGVMGEPAQKEALTLSVCPTNSNSPIENLLRYLGFSPVPGPKGTPLSGTDSALLSVLLNNKDNFDSFFYWPTIKDFLLTGGGEDSGWINSLPKTREYFSKLDEDDYKRLIFSAAIPGAFRAKTEETPGVELPGVEHMDLRIMLGIIFGIPVAFLTPLCHFWRSQQRDLDTLYGSHASSAVVPVGSPEVPVDSTPQMFLPSMPEDDLKRQYEENLLAYTKKTTVEEATERIKARINSDETCPISLEKLYDLKDAVLSKYGVIYSHNHILRWLLNLRSTDHFRRPMEPTHLIGIQHLVDEVVQERRAAATTNIQRVVRGYQERERLKEADQRSKA